MITKFTQNIISGMLAIMKRFILDLTHLESIEHKDALIQTAFNHGFNEFIIDDALLQKMKNFTHYILYSYLPTLPDTIPIIHHQSDSFSHAELPTQSAWGIFYTLESKADEEIIIADAQKNPPFIICQATNWKIIPFENLIAHFQEKPTRLYAHVQNSIQDAQFLISALELGVDGIVFSPTSSDQLIKLSHFQDSPLKFQLFPAKIETIKDISKAERVCVDTSSILAIGEGMLVGNTAEGFGLIHAEVFDSEFVTSRPFRVNAGDVSEYILVPASANTEQLQEDSKKEQPASQFRTKYLSELQAGDSVLVVNSEGLARIVSIGRVKIETRPMRMLKLTSQGDKNPFSIVITVQYAETVRLVRPDKSIVAITDLKVGDHILVAQGPHATHFGQPITENILEK
jgi:3-dehydroquinate synthase II